MDGIVLTRVRKIGSSVGVLLPKEQMDELNVQVGDDIEIAILKHRKAEEIQKAFGAANHFTEPFERDKRTREF